MNTGKDKKGNVVVISGPSGVGKSTIVHEVSKRLDNVYVSISCTSRTKSKTEEDGRDYWFISQREFEKRIRQGLFLEHAKVFGHLYGTPADNVHQALEDDKTVILEIDVQGGQQIKQTYPDAVMIFILPPAESDLLERITNRGREGKRIIEERLGGAGTEIAAAWQNYNHMVINDNLEQAVNEVVQIITRGQAEGSPSQARAHNKRGN
jgi:guanylate kinase